MVEMDGTSGLYGGKRNEYLKQLEVYVRIILKSTLIRNIVRVIGCINLAVDKEQRLCVVHTAMNLMSTIKRGVCVCVRARVCVFIL
jgi:hypothetical protein